MSQLAAEGATPLAQYPANAKQEQKAFVQELKLPNENAAKSYPKLVMLGVLAVVIVESVLLLIFVASQKSALTHQGRLFDDAQTKITTGSTKEYDTDMRQITAGLAEYKKLAAEDRNFVALWQDIGKHFTPNTRVKSLTVDDNNVVKINGEAKEFGDIAKLIASLSKAETLRNITVVSTNTTEISKEFSLKAVLVNLPKK